MNLCCCFEICTVLFCGICIVLFWHVYCLVLTWTWTLYCFEIFTVMFWDVDRLFCGICIVLFQDVHSIVLKHTWYCFEIFAVMFWDMHCLVLWDMYCVVLRCALSYCEMCSVFIWYVHCLVFTYALYFLKRTMSCFNASKFSLKV